MKIKCYRCDEWDNNDFDIHNETVDFHCNCGYTNDDLSLKEIMEDGYSKD